MNDASSPFEDAISDLGGPTKAGAILGRSQGSISEALNDRKKPSAVLSMKIEKATNGKYLCEELRPDLADLFTAVRSRKAKRRAA